VRGIVFLCGSAARARADSGDYRVVASEPVSQVYLYNTITERYEFSEARSVFSPLETYWYAR
jgi:hypothetical protein